MKRNATLFFLIIMCFQFSKAQSSFIKADGDHFLLNNKPFYFIVANYWYGDLLSLEKDKSKEGDPYIGDPPMEEQGLNTVFISDKRTRQIIDSVYNKFLKIQ